MNNQEAPGEKLSMVITEIGKSFQALADCLASFATLLTPIIRRVSKRLNQVKKSTSDFRETKRDLCDGVAMLWRLQSEFIALTGAI